MPPTRATTAAKKGTKSAPAKGAASAKTSVSITKASSTTGPLTASAKGVSNAARARAEALLSEIARRKGRIAEDFYEIGEALRELSRKKLYAALGHAKRRTTRPSCARRPRAQARVPGSVSRGGCERLHGAMLKRGPSTRSLSPDSARQGGGRSPGQGGVHPASNPKRVQLSTEPDGAPAPTPTPTPRRVELTRVPGPVFGDPFARAEVDLIDRLEQKYGASEGSDVDTETDESSDSDDQEYGLTVDFLDVGQGDGTLVVCPDGTTILVDLGSTKNKEVAGSDAVTFLVRRLMELQVERKLDAPTLDRLYLTHSDKDHYNLLPELCARVLEETGQHLVISDLRIGGQPSEYKELGGEFFERYPAKTYPQNHTDQEPEMVGREKEVGLRVLSANLKGARHSTYPNPNSIVLMISYAGRSVILMGDAEAEVESAILQRTADSPGLLRTNALKLGHHGAQAATTKEWLEATQPERVFVSADMQWSHPYTSVIERVEANGSVVDDFKHTVLSGSGGIRQRAYEQRSTSAAIYGTMGTMTPDAAAPDTAKEKHVSVQGVQRQLIILADGAIQTVDTLGNEGDVFL